MKSIRFDLQHNIQIFNTKSGAEGTTRFTWNKGLKGMGAILLFEKSCNFDCMANLTEKQELFCQLYIIDFNATKAAKEAGYSEDTAHSIGWENLRKPEIQDRISEIRAGLANRFNISKERIAQELSLIAFGDTKNVFDEHGNLKPPSEWTDEGRVVSSYEESITTFGDDDNGGIKTTKKVRQWDKIKAIEVLTKLMGYNEPDKIETRTLIKVSESE